MCRFGETFEGFRSLGLYTVKPGLHVDSRLLLRAGRYCEQKQTPELVWDG